MTWHQPNLVPLLLPAQESWDKHQCVPEDDRLFRPERCWEDGSCLRDN